MLLETVLMRIELIRLHLLLVHHAVAVIRRHRHVVIGVHRVLGHEVVGLALVLGHDVGIRVVLAHHNPRAMQGLLKGLEHIA